MSKDWTVVKLLDYKDFYFEYTKKTTKLYFARQIGKELLLKFCFNLLAQQRSGEHKDADAFLEDLFTYNQFSHEEDQNYRRLILRLNHIRKTYQEHDYEFIAIESLLSLYIWVSTEKNIPDSNIIGPATALPLFKLLLLFNDDFNTRSKKARLISWSHDPFRRSAHHLLAISYPQHDLNNVDYAQVLYAQFHKGARLLNFMAVNEKYHKILTRLLNEFEVDTKEEYFKYLGSAFKPILHPGNVGLTQLRVAKDKDYEKGCFFLDKLSIQTDKIEDLQDDYVELRTRPIHRISEGNYMVIYDLFLIKKIYNGLVFTLSRLAESQRDLITGSFFGNIRDDFSEAVLMYQTLDYVVNHPGANKISGEEFKRAGFKDSEPDYYIRIGNDILLFESKDFFITGDAKLSYDFKRIEHDLKYSKTGKRDRFGKAVDQLLGNIKRIFNLQLLDVEYDCSEINIYPVIIVHDSLYSAPALNLCVNYWFEDSISEEPEKQSLIQVDFTRVCPVTIIEIDTLLFYDKNFHTGEIDLLSFIKEFHASVNYKVKVPEMNKQTEQLFNKAVQSFSTFAREKAIALGVFFHMDNLQEMLRQIGVT